MSPAWPIVAALALTACSSLAVGDAPACKGPRRPANPHGSVLAPDAPPTPLALAPAASCTRLRR